ncbi:MAG: SDR family NAD(P)-dependent oxidoreductase [Lachnospiraceae bacterium]|nr:SDR family NAD(P)-dependent oxidoreductase [Lachnospiraceae bacterium]
MIRKWATITGAGSGIGEEAAVELFDMGYSLILIGHGADKLMAVRDCLAKRRVRREKKCGPSDQKIALIAKDLSDPSGRAEAWEDIKGIIDKEGGLPAILINSAGFGAVGNFRAIPYDLQENMVDLNVEAVMFFTYRMADLMEKNGGGRILNVASSAGLFPGGPYMSVYYATKAFVVSFTNGIREELEESGSPVKVSALCPGPVNTPFNKRAGVRTPLHGISAKRCVRAAIRGMKRQQAIILPGLSIKLAAAGAKLLPAGIMLPLTAHQQKKKLRNGKQ